MSSPGEDAHTVESDLYDRAAIERLRGGSRSWQKLDEEGSRLTPHFAELMDDLFCALFKYNVVDRPEGTFPPSAALNRTVVADVIEGLAYQALRPQTLLDETRSGLAAVSIGEALLRALREDRVLTAGDLLDLWNLSEQEEEEREAQEEAQVARELAEEAAAQDGLEGAREADIEEEADGEDELDIEEEADGEDELDVEEEAEESEAGPVAPPDAQESAGDEGEQGEESAASGVPSAQAMRRAEQTARRAARVAQAQRKQKERQVRESLERVGSRLQKSLLGAAAGAATKVQDLPDALASWGRGVGGGGRLDAAQRIDLGRRLADNEKLKKLARVFGRMRENALSVRRRVLDRVDQELFDIARNQSLDDLARLVPHELVSLSHPTLRRDFYRRLLDGGLLTYALRGVDTHGHGPLVICLDNSSSMSGDKEIWSKAVTLTFVEIARRQRRRCHVVCFADARSLREFDMNPGNSWEVAVDETFDLAEYFSGGGTDFMAPLDLAMAKIRSRELRRADIVLITDGECSVDPQWREEFHRAKKRQNFSLYAILIDHGSVRGETVEDLADRVSRISELSEDGGEIFESRRHD